MRTEYFGHLKLCSGQTDRVHHLSLASALNWHSEEAQRMVETTPYPFEYTKGKHLVQVVLYQIEPSGRIVTGLITNSFNMCLCPGRDQEPVDPADILDEMMDELTYSAR
jgi:hypothetical protein